MQIQLILRQVFISLYCYRRSIGDNFAHQRIVFKCPIDPWTKLSIRFSIVEFVVTTLFYIIILAAIIAAVMVICIALSVAEVTAETLPSIERGDSSTLDILQTFDLALLLLFVIELSAKVVTAPDRKRFLMDPLNFIDFVGVFPPFFARLIDWHDDNGVQDIGSNVSLWDRILQACRLSRVLRLLRITRYSPQTRLFFRTLVRAFEPLAMLLLLLIMSIIIFSSMIFFNERGEYNYWRGRYVTQHGKASQFASIPASFW